MTDQRGDVSLGKMGPGTSENVGPWGPENAGPLSPALVARRLAAANLTLGSPETADRHAAVALVLLDVDTLHREADETAESGPTR